MKKTKHKFLVAVILGILAIILYSFFRTFFGETIDRNTYIELLEGNGKVGTYVLELNERKKLGAGDRVSTGEKSFAIIEWGDGSVTRLGAKTEILIKENEVSKNKDKISILFEIFSGKTWSNVVSFIPEDSKFIQEFNENEVAVRGTIFTLDLDKNYLYVKDHNVKIKNKSGELINIFSNQVLDLQKFTFIDIQKFFSEFFDSGFFKVNIDLDNKLYKELVEELKKSYKNLVNLSKDSYEGVSDELKRSKAYKLTLEQYQKLNFVKAKSGKEEFELKLALKKQLFSLSSGEDEQVLMESYFHDFRDSIESGKFYGTSEIGTLLLQNFHKLSFQEEFLSYLQSLEINEKLEKVFSANLLFITKYLQKTSKAGDYLLSELSVFDDSVQKGLMDYMEKMKDINTGTNGKLKDTFKNFDSKINQKLQKGFDIISGDEGVSQSNVIENLKKADEGFKNFLEKALNTK